MTPKHENKPDKKWFADIEEVCSAITNERRDQVEKWGLQEHDLATWLLILTEEVGELSASVLEARKDERWERVAEIRSEAIQVAAVAAAIVQSLNGDAV